MIEEILPCFSEFVEKMRKVLYKHKLDGPEWNEDKGRFEFTLWSCVDTTKCAAIFIYQKDFEDSWYRHKFIEALTMRNGKV